MENPFNDDEVNTPEQIEFKIHCAIVEQLPSAFPLLAGTFLHVPNRPGSSLEGYFKKMMGTKKGTSDLMLSWNINRLKCGWLEIKAPGENLKTEQNKFLSTFSAIGWHTGKADSVKRAFAIIEDWGVPRTHWGIKEPDIRSDNQKKADAFDFYKP